MRQLPRKLFVHDSQSEEIKIQNMRYQRLLSISLLIIIFLGNCGKTETAIIPEEEDDVEEEPKTYTIRIMAYNIFHGETTLGAIDMDLFGQIIKSENPDLVSLQEVDKGVTRSGGIDQTAELSTRTGLAGYFAKARDFQGGDYGVAILSKLPVEEFRNVPAYKTGTHGTTYAYAKIKLDDDTYIWFNSSHLSTDLAERTIHVQELVNYYNVVLKSEPLIISGDLNAQLPDSELQPLQQYFAESDVNLLNTFSTRTGMRSKIDFIMYPKTVDWKVLSFKRVCRPDASDHCAIVADLEYTKP